MTAYLDTHVVVAIRTMPKNKLGAGARRLISRERDLRVSPMVVLELQMLREIGRLNAAPESFLEPLHDDLGVSICDIDFAKVIVTAQSFSWTRDPFDRVIGAQALTGQGRLVSKDENIRKHCSFAVWD